MEIRSRIIKTEPINWQGLKFLQDDTFKDFGPEAYEKLKKSILENQFSQPFYVWQDKDMTLYCLDGKHRRDIMHDLKQEGVEIPDLLPGTFIDCADIQEAAELVLQYSSIYAKVTQAGMFDFITAFELDLDKLKDKIEIPEFSFPRFEQKFDIYDIESAEEPEPELDKEEDIVVKPGDLFVLNGHKIICGSFTKAGDVDRLMGKDKARIVNCDPPYNLPTDFFMKDNKKVHNHADFAMAAGEMSDEEFVAFLALIMTRCQEYSLPGAIHYLFMDFRHSWHMCEAARRVYGNPQPKQVCVWNKDIMANGAFYRAQHELCFIFNNKAAKSLWNNDLLDEGGFYKNEHEMCFIFKNGDGAKHLSHLELQNRIRTNVWRYPSAISKANPDREFIKNHPTPKPVAMVADAILDTTNKGDIVIDWFLGSGTALIACEHTQRLGRFTEIEPKYVQLAIRRYKSYCEKRNIEVNFIHSNGSLTLNDFKNEG